MPAPPERRVNYTIKREELELFLTKYPDTPLSTVAKQAFLEFLKNDGKTISDNAKSFDQKIKQQQYLKLCLQNWKELKSNGSIFEESKAIILGQKELDVPKIENVIVPQETPKESESSGLDENYFCHTCNHQHYGLNTMHNCKECNCGIRG